MDCHSSREKPFLEANRQEVKQSKGEIENETPWPSCRESLCSQRDNTEPLLDVEHSVDKRLPVFTFVY